MAREDPNFRLRIPESLLELVRQAAGKNGRSMTAEINARLAETFARDDFPSSNLPIINFQLDSKGRPISWEELVIHVHRTASAAGITVAAVKAEVVDAVVYEAGSETKDSRRINRYYLRKAKEIAKPK